MDIKAMPRAAKHIAANRRKRHWMKWMLCMVVVTVLYTFYALSLPAITLEKGEEPHVHTDACYTLVSVETETVPVCTSDSLEIHCHDKDCYGEEGKLICLYADFVAHSHDEQCYDADGKLWCTLPEKPVHEHDAGCYYTPEAEHSHGEACFGESGELICTESVQPLPAVLVCTRQEIVLHRHTADCMDENGRLQCAKIQVLEHIHEADCFAVRPVLSCTSTQEGHVHGERCYGVWELSCGYTEEDSEEENGNQDIQEPDAGQQSPSDEAQPDATLPPEEDPQEPEDEAQPPEDEGEAVGTQSNVNITYYIFINGTRYELKTQATLLEKDGERYFLTAEELEAVYGEFGFKASEYQGENLFPHTDNFDPNTLWANAQPYQKEGQWRIPLSTRNQIFVCYLPANVQGSESCFSTSKPMSDELMAQENTFYSISVYDTTGSFKNTYVRRNATLSLPLEQLEKYSWSFFNADDGAELTPDQTPQEDGSVIFTIAQVSCPVEVRPGLKDTVTEGSFTIIYTANTLAQQKAKVGQLTPELQEVLQEGSINGMASLTERVVLANDETHTMRLPDSMVLRTKVWDGRQFCYSFTGWRVRSSGTLLPYEEPLTLSGLYQYATNGVLELEAVWSPVDRVGNIQSINFYVNLACEIMDFGDNGYAAHPQSNFTQSVFNSYVSTTGQNSKFASDFQLLAPPTSEETAYEVDGILRNMPSQTYRGFTLEDFPTDGEIFAQLRAKNTQIYLDGQAIPMRYLSSDYFQIRWYVMKYDMSDGWHIDGILVAKTAKLNVTKSFMGDAATIAEIKSQTGANEFTIKVTDNRDAGDAFYLTLNPWEEELYRNDQNYYGYHSYDPTTDTYT